jgi:hypothetical protein
VKLSPPIDAVFDDDDRQRAQNRLGAVDEIGAARLRDSMWPSDDDRAWPRLRDACRPARQADIGAIAGTTGAARRLQ